VAVVLAVVALWGAAGLVLARESSARHDAVAAETLAGVQALVEAAHEEVRREAAVLARDPAIVEGALKGDWATLARGASPRMLSLTLDRRADLLLIVDAAGVPLVQVPAMPRVALPALERPGAAIGRLAVLNERVYLLGVAPLPAGMVVVGRRFESLDRGLTRLPSRPALIVLAGDRVLASTQPGLPASGWEAAVRAGQVSWQGAPWLARRLDRAGDGLWALIPDGERRAAERRFWFWWTVSLAAAALVAGAWAVTRRTPGPRPSVRERRSKELEALYAVAEAIGSADDLAATAERTLEVVCGVARMDFGGIFRLDEAAQTLTLVAHRGLSPEDVERLRVRPLDESHVGEAARTGRFIVTDLTQSRVLSPEVRERVRAGGYRAQLALPIPVSGRTWGVMALISREPREFDTDEVTLLLAVAHQVGAAVGRAALFAEARENSRRFETLTRLAQTLTATLSLDDVLQRVVDAAVELFASSVARLWLVDDDGRHVELRASAGSRSSLEGIRRFRVGEGLVGTVVASRRPLTIADVLEDPRTRNVERIRAEGTASVAVGPLVFGDRALGALSIGVRERHEYTPEELALLGLLADHAANAINNARLFSEEQTRRAYLAALLEINKKIGGVAETEPLLASIAEEAARLLDVDNAGFRLVDGDELVLAGLAGTAAETMLRPRIRIGESLSGKVVAEGRTTVCDLEGVRDLIPEHLAADRRLGYTTFLGVPLKVSDRTIGVLTFRARRPFTARDQELAEAFAGQAAIALEQSRLRRATGRQAARMAALADIGRLLSETLDFDRVAQRVADSVCALLGARSSCLYRLDRESGGLVAVTASTDAGEAFHWTQTLPKDAGIAGLAVREHRPVASADVLNDPRIVYSDEMRAGIAEDTNRALLAIPLLVRDRPFGALAMSDRAGRRFDDEEIRLARAFADQAALALENARLYTESTRRRLEAEELARLARTLTESLEVQAVGDRIVESVITLFRAHSSALRLLESDGSLVTLALGGPIREVLTASHMLRPGVGIAGRAVSEGRPVASSDILSDTRVVLTEELSRGVAAKGVGAVLAVPLRVKGRIIGALSISDRTGRVFAEPEAALLQAFADQAALALENARLFSLETARREQIATLAEIERELAAELDPDRLLRMVVERATRLFGANGVIYLVEDGGGLVPRAWTEHVASGNIPLALGQGVVGSCAELRQGLVVNDYPGSLLALGPWLEAGVRRAMANPLVMQDRLLGVIGLNRTGDASPPFLAEDLAVLESFAARAAVALENARLYREAREHAERLAALEEVNRLVSSSLKMDEVLRNIAAAVARFFDAPYVSVWVLDDARRRLSRSLTYGDPEPALPLTRELALGEGAIGWVALHREPMLWADVEQDTRVIDRQGLLRRGLRFITAYPIAIGERVLGAFAVHRATPTPVTPETASLLGSLAAQAAVALENAHLYSETQRRLEETRALLEVVELLNATLDSKQLLKRAAMKIAQVCGVDRCSLELWEGGQVTPLMSQFADGRTSAEQWASFQAVAARPLLGIAANARARETRRPVVVNDTTDDVLMPRDWIDAFGLKSYLVVPMLRQDDVIGVMTLDYCERPTAFQQRQVDLAMTIAGQLALALENTRLYTQAQERLRETTTLMNVGQILSRPGPMSDRMRQVSREVARAFGADMVGAYFLDARKETLVPLCGYHVPRELIERFMTQPIVLARTSELLSAWREGRAVWSGNPRADARFDPEWIDALPPHSILFASALARGEPIGGLFVVWWHPGRQFQPAEIRLMEGVAAQVGLAMENAELARQTQIKLRETETLLTVSRALSSTLDLQALLRHFLRSVTRAVDADSAGVWMREGDGEWMEPVAGYHVPPDRVDALRQVRVSLVRHPFYAEAARTKRPVSSSHVTADPRGAGILADVLPHRSQLFVPIIAKERVIGGFGLIWVEREREFSEGELALMEAIASQAGVAVENARLFEENRQQVEEMSVLHALSRAVTGQLDRAAVLDAIHAEVGRVLDARNMLIALRDEERSEYEVTLRVVDGVPDMHAPLRYPARAVGLMSVVFETGRAVRTDDYEAECARHGVEAIVSSAQLRHWLGVPMIAGDTVLGVLALRGGGRAFTEADERLLTNIAHLAALALRSARLFEERTRAYGELAAAQDQLVRTEKLRALGEMASGVAHDFNNLLASILGRAQLTLQRIQNPQLRQWLQVIERAALDGAQTVRRLQEFTRIRRDQPLIAVDLNEVVRDALEITQSRWREEPVSRGVTLEVRTSFAELPRVAGDPAELREALTNLILNAVDAMPAGGAITLKTAVSDGAVVVSVADTGVGIPEAIRDRIFDPFFTTKGPRGTGLGLSMTYGILERHGARITVESEEGRGTVFRLAFRPGAAEEPAAAAPPAEAASGGGSLRCLVVDDEPAVAAMLGDVLESGGHRAVVVHDGGEGIARFSAEPFDVVFTDLAMPRVSGWQVARAIKELAPIVPVFLVTGFGVELSAEERRAHGVDRVLVKPLKIQEILDAVAQVARRRAHPIRTEDD
jgi:GAF domain-containing protein/CheY-like chemotaxis protein